MGLTLPAAGTRDQRTDLALALAALAALAAPALLREDFPHQNGMGFDGAKFGVLARDLDLGSLDAYMLQRILPPLAVHGALRALGLPLTDANVVSAFVVLDLLAIAAGTWFCCRAAGLAGAGAAGRFVAWCAVVLCHAHLKMAMFHPTMTDSTAFAFGAAAVHAHLAGRTGRLAAIALAGAFVWPLALPFGALLLAFPRGPERVDPWPAPRAARAAAAVLALGALLLVGYTLAFAAVPICVHEAPIRALLPISVAIVGAWVFVTQRALLDSADAWAALSPRRLLASPRVWIAAAGVVAVRIFFDLAAAQPMALAFTTRAHFERIAYESVIQPGVFLVAHVLWFGPVLLLVPFVARPIVRAVHRQGPGPTLALAAIAWLAISSNSRQLVHSFPFLVPYLAVAAEGLEWSRPRRLAFAALSIAMAKVWLPMARDLEVPGFGHVSWSAVFWSSQGPWMNHRLYAVQAAAVVAAVPIVWLAFVRRRTG